MPVVSTVVVLATGEVRRMVGLCLGDVATASVVCAAAGWMTMVLVAFGGVFGWAAFAPGSCAVVMVTAWGLSPADLGDFGVAARSLFHSAAAFFALICLATD